MRVLYDELFSSIFGQYCVSYWICNVFILFVRGENVSEQCKFILCQDDLGNYEIRDGDKIYHFLYEVAPILNEQQDIIKTWQHRAILKEGYLQQMEEQKSIMKKQQSEIEYWKHKCTSLLWILQRYMSKKQLSDLLVEIENDGFDLENKQL